MQLLNITELINAAASKDVLWKINLFHIALDQLTNSNCQVSFWKEEEAWAIIIYNDYPIGYLWERYPLAFILSKYAIGIKNILKQHDFIEFVELVNLSDKVLFIEPKELTIDIEYGIDYNCFSVEDFWFYTNAK